MSPGRPRVFIIGAQYLQADRATKSVVQVAEVLRATNWRDRHLWPESDLDRICPRAPHALLNTGIAKYVGVSTDDVSSRVPSAQRCGL